MHQTKKILQLKLGKNIAILKDLLKYILCNLPKVLTKFFFKIKNKRVKTKLFYLK